MFQHTITVILEAHPGAFNHNVPPSCTNILLWMHRTLRILTQIVTLIVIPQVVVAVAMGVAVETNMMVTAVEQVARLRQVVPNLRHALSSPDQKNFHKTAMRPSQQSAPPCMVPTVMDVNV
eukprot:CAMPEP_0174385446 /NCGR_PEP_ID=MMETSP0811_2-20130205/126606_1 /TAXON_ID=73025 ORGANISM="Eutreptiella gymnastica-like, Strain CCMP1594" /NCGR_SAMPLE_ID=MMETSP0811_2 /ASSEMBLY_ACC=CAM_ASM_000667 /LENGTH=120 /DNA_ID=CAMNT_0015539765 /DNA_START=592 /DNA_END=951 /DNA_ORIENTATION=-